MSDHPHPTEASVAHAVRLATHKLHAAEQAWGADHLRLVPLLETLSQLLDIQDSDPEKVAYADDDPVLVLDARALAIREKHLLLDLAEVYSRQHRADVVPDLYRRILTIDEELLGDDHPTVATDLIKLAEVCHSSDSAIDSQEPLLQRALRIREAALGPDHPDVAGAAQVLADYFLCRERFAEAEPLFLRAVAIQEQAFGPNHAAVGETISSLGQLYWEQQNYAKSAEAFQRVIDIDERCFGADSPNCALSYECYAEALRKLGRESDADAAQARADALRPSLDPSAH